MPAPRQVKRYRKAEWATEYVKSNSKPVLFTEAVGRPSSIAPNVRSLSWSPAGNLIATSISSHIRVWTPDRPQVAYSTQIRSAGGVSAIEKLAFSPAHEAVLASIGPDGFCRLWDVRTPSGVATSGKGTKLSEYKTGDSGLFLTWRPDGQELLVGRKDDVVQLVDIRRMTTPGGEEWRMSAQEKTPRTGGGQLNGMAFSNSGHELFVTTGDGPVQILDWPSLEVLHTLNGHVSATNVVQQSPVGRFVAVGGNDSIVTLWDTTNWTCAHALSGYASSIRDMSFSFDGSFFIASCGADARDGTAGLHVYHVDSGESIVTLDTVNPVTWCAWHPFRYWIAYAGDPGGLKIYGSGSSW